MKLLESWIILITLRLFIFFRVVKSSSGGYKIELLGDVLNMQVRNKLINELFLVLSPGISNSVLILKNINK